MNSTTADTREFREYLRLLGAEVADPIEGFFGPRSAFWKVGREVAINLGGIRALLMQIAHPKVAQGVADYSRFREDPFERVSRTFQAIDAIVFGTCETAIEAAVRIHGIHTPSPSSTPRRESRLLLRYTHLQ